MPLACYYLDLLEELDSKSGVFGKGINDFGDLLASAFNSDNFFDELSKGFNAMTRDV